MAYVMTSEAIKADAKVRRILNSDASDSLKISKLGTLALRSFPSSPYQIAVRALITDMTAQVRR